MEENERFSKGKKLQQKSSQAHEKKFSQQSKTHFSKGASKVVHKGDNKSVKNKNLNDFFAKFKVCSNFKDGTIS